MEPHVVEAGWGVMLEISIRLDHPDIEIYFFSGSHSFCHARSSVLQRFLNRLGLLARFLAPKLPVPLLVKASVALRHFSVHASIGLADS